MTIVDIDEAPSRLPDLLARVRRGEEVAIAEHDRVFARLVPVAPTPSRMPGRLKGKIALTPAFFEPLPADERAGWEPE